MDLTTITRQDDRLSYAWYVKYPLDAYALGPYRFDHPVPATDAVELALEGFGERPNQVWPDGRVIETDEYEYELDVPEGD